MRGQTSSRARWALWTLLAALLGLGAAVLLERRGPLEQCVLSHAPAEASIVAYAELELLRDSNVLGRLVRERLMASAGLRLVEPDVDAVAVALGSDEIVGLAAGRFPLGLVRRYLEDNGASCPAALDERACSLSTPGGLVSIRGLGDGLLGATLGPRPASADRLVAASVHGTGLAEAARAALDRGALVWMKIDPRRLAETMSDPPDSWVNLSLVARALLSASEASLELEDAPEGGAVTATLRAECASEADAAELARMLESLSALAAHALRRSASERSRAWANALAEGFHAEPQQTRTAASWQLPAALLEESVELELGR